MPSEMLPQTTDSRPVPDPTVLTTQQLFQAILALRELIESRLNGMDKAISLVEQANGKLPERIDEKLSAITGVQNEKFASIKTQFGERDTRDERSARDGKLAIDAALQAAKEAVAKSEVGITKQIDQLAAIIVSTKATLDDKISDIKDRLVLIEGAVAGVKDFKAASQSTGQYWIAIIGGFVGLIGLGLAIAAMMARK